MNGNIRKMVFMGLFLAFAIILSYVEYLIPIPIGIPGIKPGLANIAILVCLYRYGAREAVCVHILRIVISSFLFGNLYTLLYSLAGGLFSFLVMLLMKQLTSLHMSTISVCGGMMHNIGQLCVAAAVVGTKEVFYYLPVLVLAGMIAGLVCGIAAEQLQLYLNRYEITADSARKDEWI